MAPENTRGYIGCSEDTQAAQVIYVICSKRHLPEIGLMYKSKHEFLGKDGRISDFRPDVFVENDGIKKMGRSDL